MSTFAEEFSTRLAQHLHVDLTSAGYNVNVPDPVHIHELEEFCGLLGVGIADYVAQVEVDE